MKSWSMKEVKSLGDDMAQFGGGLVMGRLKISPTEKIKVDGKEQSFIAVMLDAISAKEDITVTLARRLIEDAVSLACSQETPTKEWVESVMKQGVHWKCAQSWTEKIMKKLVDASGGDGATKAKEWSSLVLNQDQAIAMTRLEENYRHLAAKKKKKEAEGKTVKNTTMSNSLFSVWRI